MKSDQYKLVKEVFMAAAELAPEHRDEYLTEACEDNHDLRLEVERLLTADDSEFMEEPAMAQVADIIAEESENELTKSHPDSPKNKIFGRYKIISKIGEGGMGEVFLAKDTTLDRKVALKILPPELTNDDERMRRFEQEARAASSLNHPFILTIHEFRKNEDGRHFIASEYVEGETLDEHCAKKKIGLPAKLDIAIQLASALRASHQAGIIHRDIKPANIMVRPDGFIKVLDFGLAKLMGSFKPETRDSEVSTRLKVVTRSRTIMGTAPYMSPEQVRGKKTDPRTDIWSLGVVLYEMLTGQRPFKGETEADTIASILKKEPLPITAHFDNLPSELERIVAKALNKNADRRYQNVDKLKSDLERSRKQIDVSDVSGHPASAATPKSSVEIDSPKTDLKQIHESDGFAETTEKTAAYETKSLLNRAPSSLVLVLGTVFVGVAVIATYFWFFDLNRTSLEKANVTAFRSTEITSWSSGPAELSTSAPFSPNGKMIAFGSAKSGTPGIWVTQAAAGTPIEVTKDKFYNRFPIWSPSGEELAYYSKRGDEFGIWRISFTGGQATLVTKVKDAESRPRFWSKSGNIYYQNADNLFVINERTRENEQITVLPSPKDAARSFQVSPNETKIAFVEKDGDNWKILVGSIDGTAARDLFSSTGNISDLVWHPREQKLFYSQMRDKVYQIFELDLAGGPPVQISNSDFDSHIQGIAGDGERILFSSARENSDIWRVPTDRSTEVIVAAEKEAELWADPSSAGTELSYQTIKNLNKGNNLYSGSIWKKSIATENRRPTLLVDEGFLPVWSPDGRHLAFMRHRGGQFELWTVPGTGGEPIRSGKDGIQGFSYAMTPYNRVDVKHLCWSPESDSIVFPATKDKISNLWRVTRQGANTGPVTRNTDPNLRIVSPIWASSGDSIAYSSFEKLRDEDGRRTFHIWIKELADSKERKLVETKENLRLLGFNESEEKLVYAKQRRSSGFSHTPPEIDLYDVSIQDGTISKVETLRNANFFNIHLSPDGKTIGFAGRSDELEEIWITSLYENDSRRLLASKDPRILFSNLAWSIDGKYLFFGKQSRFSLLSVLAKSKKNGENK
jgi:serine/threonine protein kinase